MPSIFLTFIDGNIARTEAIFKNLGLLLNEGRFMFSATLSLLSHFENGLFYSCDFSFFRFLDDLAHDLIELVSLFNHYLFGF